MQTFIEANRISFSNIFHDVSFSIHAGEITAVVGVSGSGKSLLGQIVAGQLQPTQGELVQKKNLRTIVVEQQDDFFAQSGMRNTYDSRRYEFSADSLTPTVADFLKAEKEVEIINTLNIKYLLDRQLLLLSNGERKRVQIAWACLQNPDVFVFDQPFVGLDAVSREVLLKLLQQLKNQGKGIMLICNEHEIPVFVDKMLKLNPPENQEPARACNSCLPFGDETAFAKLEKLLAMQSDDEIISGTLVQMTNVRVQMGEQVILDNINWTIRTGERWLLAGANGSGKSTLLSLITADNPQAYRNDIRLFDSPRGSGESIWDIKRRIGYVSPELHLYFLRQTKLSGLRRSISHSVDCMSVVLSGFHDEVGFSSDATVWQHKTAAEWLQLLGLQALMRKQFAEISLGEQRMLLLVRALVKNPPLLILDEPCQGIDHVHAQRFLRMLDFICSRRHTTMVYVSHSPREIPDCITHRLELCEGRVVC